MAGSNITEKQFCSVFKFAETTVHWQSSSRTVSKRGIIKSHGKYNDQYTILVT